MSIEKFQQQNNTLHIINDSPDKTLQIRNSPREHLSKTHLHGISRDAKHQTKKKYAKHQTKKEIKQTKI